MYVSVHVSEGWEIPEVEKKVVVAVMLGGGEGGWRTARQNQAKPNAMC